MVFVDSVLLSRATVPEWQELVVATLFIARIVRGSGIISTALDITALTLHIFLVNLTLVPRIKSVRGQVLLIRLAKDIIHILHSPLVTLAQVTRACVLWVSALDFFSLSIDDSKVVLG